MLIPFYVLIIVNWSFQFCAADQCDLYTNLKKKKKKKKKKIYQNALKIRLR